MRLRSDDLRSHGAVERFYRITVVYNVEEKFSFYLTKRVFSEEHTVEREIVIIRARTHKPYTEFVDFVRNGRLCSRYHVFGMRSRCEEHR